MAAPQDTMASYQSAFDKAEGELAAVGGPLVRDLRQQAMARFGELGFPSAKMEAWRHTDVGPIARRFFPPALEAHEDGVGRERLSPFLLHAGHELVFLDGRHAPELSSVGELPAGVRLAGLAAALREDPAGVGAHLGRYAPFDDHAFRALNTAFFQDGAFIEIPPHAVLPEPIHLLYVTTHRREPAALHPRNLVVAGEGSQSTVVESYVDLGGTAHLTNAVTEVLLRERATVDHYKLQQEDEAAYHIATVEAVQERSSNFRSHSLSFGGALTRNDINTRMTAEGSECALNGLFVVGGKQHVDHHTLIDHERPHCTSRELYKGILDRQARGVFYGRIVVHPNAQKTDAYQLNKNLLLSDEALVDSTPQLEIRNNDVKCKHGSTIGQLQDEALFYMRSRGIDVPSARSILIYAFAREVVDLIRPPPLRARVVDLLASRLPKGEAIREFL